MRKSTMRLVAPLVLALVSLSMSMSTTAQQVTFRGSFAEPGISGTVDARNFRVAFSRVTVYFFLATPTECLFKIEQSDFGITWEDLIPLRDCTSEEKFEFITPIINKVLRVNLPVFTTTPPGVVFVFWEGYTGERCGKDYDGIFSTVVGSDPAAGTELSITVPSIERWRVYSAAFRLQADSTVGDREVFLTASENGNEYFRVFADGVVKADQEGIFTTAALGFVGTAGLGPSSINQPTDVRTILIPIYSDAFIPSGHTLATDTNGMEPDDDYSPAVVLVEKCPN